MRRGLNPLEGHLLLLKVWESLNGSVFRPWITGSLGELDSETGLASAP